MPGLSRTQVRKELSELLARHENNAAFVLDRLSEVLRTLYAEEDCPDGFKWLHAAAENFAAADADEFLEDDDDEDDDDEDDDDEDDDDDDESA